MPSHPSFARPRSGRPRAWQLASVLLASLLGLTPSASAVPVQHGVFEPGMGSTPLLPVVSALPPLPPPTVFPVQLVLDDDSAEGAFGFDGGNARQFLWFNRFANPNAFSLEEVWVLFPSGGGVPVGGTVQIVVYLDADGDPGNGAQLLASFDETIQAADGATFSVFPLATPLDIADPGDVLIGVVSRYFQTGIDPPPTRPAALDDTASQNRSYVALWPGDPPDPPDLATASNIVLLDGAASGNFMIRGFGTFLPTQVPALDPRGLALLALLIGLAGVILASRR